MTDDGFDPDPKEAEAFNTREDVLEAAMPVLAEFFHIVRCPNHTKAERTAAYDAACAVWDRLEEAYVREVTGSGDSPHGEYGGEGRIGTKPDGEHMSEAAPYVTHPGSRAIN